MITKHVKYNSHNYLKMASREDWCVEKVSNLLQEDLRIVTLNEIKEHLTSLPQQEISRTVLNIDLPLVFDCLNDSNTEQIDLACEVLTLCMTNLNLGESTDRYAVSIEQALNHPYHSVKLMALNEIERNIRQEEILVSVCKSTSLLNSIVRCVGDSNLTVAQKAIDILIIIGQSYIGLRRLTSNEVLTTIREIMGINEITRLRVYELVVKLSKESELNFDELISTGLVGKLLDEFNKNDILLKMNIVELFGQLGSCGHGYVYLEENGIILNLFSLIDDNEDFVTVQLCEPNIIRFFGVLAHQKPIELLSKYPKFFDRMFSNIESGDLVIVGASLGVLSIMACSNEGKCALHSTGNKLSYAVRTIVKLLGSLPTETKLAALNCLENLLRVPEKKNDIMQITRKWYGLFGDNPMEFILRYANNPFTELRSAGLKILYAIAEQQWGQEEIRNSPGLIEFLLDRGGETHKECKELKYEIVKLLSNSTLFEQTTTTRLQEFVKQGPFYVQGVTEVAFE